MDFYLVFDPNCAPEGNLAKNAIEALEFYHMLGRENAKVWRVTPDYPCLDVTADFYEQTETATDPDEYSEADHRAGLFDLAMALAK